MKKRFVTLLLALLAALTLTVPAWAEQQPGDPFIYDTAGLLSDGDRAYLEQMADAISWQYQCGVYIVTVDDYEVYGSDRYSAALNIYRGNDFGIGDGRDGIMLMLSMWDRDYEVFIQDGGLADSAFGSYAVDLLEEAFLPYLGNDDWYGGFHAYLTTCSDDLALADMGQPVKKPLTKVILPALLVGCGVALLICLLLKAKMKSVRKGAEADVYVTAEGLDLTKRYDRYTHTTETRVRKNTRDDHDSGGGGHGSGGKF